MAKVQKKVIKKRRDRKNVEAGHAHIRSTFNNTIVTITDVQGNTISWSSSGGQGFKGSRKNTPYAAQTAAEAAAKGAIDHGMKTVEVYVRPSRYTDKFIKDNDYFVISFIEFLISSIAFKIGAFCAA